MVTHFGEESLTGSLWSSWASSSPPCGPGMPACAPEPLPPLQDSWGCGPTPLNQPLYEEAAAAPTFPTGATHPCDAPSPLGLLLLPALSFTPWDCYCSLLCPSPRLAVTYSTWTSADRLKSRSKQGTSGSPVWAMQHMWLTCMGHAAARCPCPPAARCSPGAPSVPSWTRGPCGSC